MIFRNQWYPALPANSSPNSRLSLACTPLSMHPPCFVLTNCTPALWNVEWNGFIHSMLTGTPLEEKDYRHCGPRAYSGFIRDR